MATRLVWITMLAMADRKGRVWASVPGLANRARVAVKDAEKAIHTFLSPDPHSRTPDFEGRRIEPIDGGWLLLNYLKYRDVRDQDDEREKTAERVRRYRERQRLAAVTDVTHGNDNAEAEAEAEADKKTKNKAQAPFMLPDWIPQDHWQAWIEARTKARKAPTDYAKRLAVLKLENLRDQGYAPAQVLMASAFNGWSGLFPPKEIK